MNNGKVHSLFKSPSHSFHKYEERQLNIIEGLGVEGDAHAGTTVKHRSRVAKDPTQPNLRQVHLIHAELFEELRLQGFTVHPGEMGENITTSGLPLLDLPKDTLLKIGSQVILKVIGLRNPCHQINAIQDELMQALISKNEKGELIRKAGIMTVVMTGGKIHPDDNIEVTLPPPPYQKLEKV